MILYACLTFLCLLLAAALGGGAGRRAPQKRAFEGGARAPGKAEGAPPPRPGPGPGEPGEPRGAFDVRIIVAGRGGGVQLDAELLAERFTAAGARAEVVRHSASPAWRPVFVQVFVEHVQTERFEQVYPAAWHFLLVNQEFVYDWDLAALKAGSVRALCKTRAGVEALRGMGVAGELLGFGGRPEPEGAGPPQPGLALHLAGPSPLKGTLALLRAWVALGPARGEARLFVGCRGPAAEAVRDFWASLGPAPARFELPGLALETEAAEGIHLCRAELPEAAAAALRRAAAVHACPSAAEGWGHILDRARWCGALVVTLDAPPMNELLDGGSAVLAAAADDGPVAAHLPPAWRRFYPPGVAGPRAVRPAPGALEAALRQALGAGPAERARLGGAARARAGADAEAFSAAVARLWAAPFGPSALRAPAAYPEYAVGEPGPAEARASYDGDFRFRVDGRDRHIQAALRRGYPYGKLVTLVLSALARPGDVACDVGANVGTVAVPLSRAAGGIQVLAFEPQPEHYELLCGNVAANRAGGVVAFRAALAHAPGLGALSRALLEPAGPGGPLVESRRDSGAAELNLGAVQLGEGGEPVRLLSLDALGLPRLDLLKVDAEGAEPLVFFGARETIRRSRPAIVFEANRVGLPAEMRRALAPPAEAADFDILAFCRGLGYRRLVEVGVQDYLLVPPGRAPRDPRFRTRRVGRLVGLEPGRTAGFELEKLARQRWGAGAF